MLVVKAYAGDRLLLADSGLIRQIQSGWFASLAVAPSAEVRAFLRSLLIPTRRRVPTEPTKLGFVGFVGCSTGLLVNRLGRGYVFRQM